MAIYRAKQEQKINQALAKADEAYTIVKQGLAKNNTFNDCINFIKQKFGNDELLINFVMDNINADLATLKEKEQEILDKNAQIEKNTNDYEDEIEAYQGTIERLDNVNKALQTSLNNEKATNAELIAKNVSLEQELKAKDDEIVELENKLEEANNQKKEYIDKGNEYWEYAGDYLLKAIRRGYQPTNYEIEFYKISEELEKLKQNDLVTEDGGSGGSSRSRQR